MRYFTLLLVIGAELACRPGAGQFARADVADVAAVGPAEQKAAVEPWTDRRLPGAAGLVAWYDATTENSGRLANRQPEASNGKPLDVWHDGSAPRRDLVQSNSTAQPNMRIDVGIGSVRFDGRASYLASDEMNLTFDDLTIFVVGASFSNPGHFSAFLAMNEKGENDYTSGLTLDQGAKRSKKFDSLNVEGAGFRGPRNLGIEPSEPGHLRRMCVTSTIGPGGTTLYVDGKLAGRRDRGKSRLRMDRLTLGARFYTNGGPPATRGFLAGEIAEALIYDRVLNDPERAAVERYLLAKYGASRLAPMPSEMVVRPIAAVKDPPPVQMLAPGFAARRLPVDLTNVNNVRYRNDGKLVALAYNGRIYVLSDSDGDGLEDRADVFWDQPGIAGPIGMALTPPGYARGQGVFIACKGRVILIVDKDGDDRGDELIVVADGWQEIKHNVDALGVAVGSDGSVYFGLGTAAFTNGYQLDKEKQSHYDPNGERGSILKVSPGFKHREPICSGVRFSVALAFNRFGDLFCTDQEGATWLSNGNPFDELLHIEPGRHYGFPPRHPMHLPNVIDEPSVYDYTPQHQSACGLCFNEPVNDGPAFGPAWWRSDALVTGYSRGKLYRTTLVKTPHGYVADNCVLACLNELTADACVSPRGELVVAVHSGGPDWGSGPRGKGTLYKVSYVDRDCPQPVRAWAASPQEVRIAFDRPLDLHAFKNLAQQVLIEAGAHVRAGDRFEFLRPGYAVIEQQELSPRRLLPVLAASMTSDRRAIVLSTAAQEQAVSYNIILPAPRREAASQAPAGALAQLPEIELNYDLSGVEATWQSASGADDWSMWLPHLDLGAAQALLAGSAEADRLAAALAAPGKLTLRTQLDLWQMLRPAAQPGSKLDYEPPEEHVTVELASTVQFLREQLSDGLILKPVDQVRHNDRQGFVYDPKATVPQRAQLPMSPREGRWLSLEVTVPTGSVMSPLEVSWHTAEDSRPRAFAQRRFLLPWARPASAEAAPARKAPAELAGGDWNRGRAIFFGDRAQCSKCHRLRDQGGWIGPDLSNLIHRDYASVLRDIALPSFAINPDHVAYTLVLNDGRVLTGMVQTRGDTIAVGDIKGMETVVSKGDIEEMTPTLLSIMPEGLPKAIGEPAMRDLLTFLLLPEPGIPEPGILEPGILEPAPIERSGAPPPRSRAAVEAVLKDAPPVDAATLKPLEIVLCAGPKDHGASEHDYPQWRERWTQLLGMAPRVRVAAAELWPSAEQWNTADCVAIFSANQGWSPERARELDAFFARGGGLILLHYAVNGGRAPQELADRVGLAWQGQRSKFRHGPLDLHFPPESKHPITAGFTKADFIDESYWNLVGDPGKITILANQTEDGAPRPLLWTFEPGRGRVFVSILGHYNWTFDDPLFRVLVLRGVAWTTRQPVDRFNDLVFRGARVGEP